MPKWTTRVDQLAVKMKAQGHRVTPQRIAVLNALCADAAHPSAEAIHNKVKADFPMTSLATVYKTIGVLKAMGEVMELEFSQNANRYDGQRPYPHPHLVCTGCDRIMDPEVAGIDDLTGRIAAATGFQINTHRLDFFGLCPQCQSAADSLAPEASSGRSS